MTPSRRKRDLSWCRHVLIGGRWNHEYDAYLNHQASGARAPKRGVSVDWLLCNCTEEQRANAIIEETKRGK